MNRKNMTRNALVTSIISLLLCVSMLVGTTFAWFTDSATSAANKIQAGNLDVELYQWTAADASTNISTESKAVMPENILWEPGKTQVVYLSIKNEGSLDLKYKVNVNVKDTDGEQDLYEAMRYAIIPDAKFDDVKSWNGGKTVNVGVNATDANDVALKHGEEHFFALAVHMDENAGNKYQGGNVEFDISVLAGQLTSESDSFGSTYDALAGYPGTGVASKPSANDNVSAIEINVYNDDDVKVGSAIVPVEAIADDAENVEVHVNDSAFKGNFTIDDGMTSKAVDVTVTGLKEGNTTPVKVTLYAPMGLDPATVKLYHYETEIPCTYNPSTGYVTFESATFSPFTIVYDADSKYENPDAEESDLPKATVTRASQHENVVLPWGNYGQWSPKPELGEAKLEAAYIFKSVENADEAAQNPYAQWHCDFFVKLDRDLDVNQIFLGGNYGDFGWVGFHNGELTLEANTEIGLLAGVTTNPWTYLDIASFVGEFVCGVGDVDNALSGATFTVTLRLTNPDNAEEFYDIESISYTFN